MPATARLRFRRHLAFCVCALLAWEIFGQIEPMGQQGRRAIAYRTSRIRLARAAELEVAPDAGVYQHDTELDTNIFVRLLNQAQDYLPVMNFNFTLNPDEDLAMSPLDVEVDAYYHEQWASVPNLTVDGLQLISVRAALRTAPMPLHTSWGYENREMARLGSEPVRNDDLCAAQLAHLQQRLEQALVEGASGAAPGSSGALLAEASPVENFEARQIYYSHDVDLFRYLDSFGRVPSDSLRGNVKWFGSYSACLSTRLRPLKASRNSPESWHKVANNQQAPGKRLAMKFRYCMGAMKSLDWSQQERKDDADQLKSHRSLGVTQLDHQLHNFFLRVGLCLPEACDSSALEKRDNQRAIERLAKFSLAKPFNSDHYKFTDLYCLPDQRSSFRTVPLLGKLLVLAILGWLGLVGLITIIHLNVDKFYTKTVEQIRRAKKDEPELKRGTRRPSAVAAQRSSRNSTSGSETELADESDRLRRAGQAAKLGASIASNLSQHNEFEEADFMELKLNWIKLNVWARDQARSLIPGVDLIECLSLYSNWLRYTRRVKLAVVRLFAHEQLNERRLKRNERLLPAQELRRAIAAAAAAASKLNGGAEPDRTTRTQAQKSNDDEVERRAAAGRRQLARWQDDDKLEEAMNLLLASGRGQSNMEASGDGGATRAARVDTSSLNALKVIALLWIIAGHCLYYLGSVVGNGALLMLYTNRLSSFALANGAIYITELFFVITGCLTAYLSFKYNTRLVRLSTVASATGRDSLEMTNNSATSKKATTLMIGDPSNANEMLLEEKQLMEPRIFGLPFWVLTIANRYLRILPTYLLVYAIVKLISIYVGGEGNLWDYAVSKNSVRRACVQESWLPVLTLTTNFLDIYKHCIVGGWYLSVDFQFAIISVPLLMFLAHCQRMSARWLGPSGRLGKKTFASSDEAESEGATSSKATNDSNGQQGRVLAVANRRITGAYLVILGAALLSALLSILNAIFDSYVDLSVILRFTPHQVAMLSQNFHLYTNSIYRFRAFAYGLITGHLLYMYEFKLIKLPKLIQLHGTKLTSAIFAIGFGIMFVPVLYPLGKIQISHDMTSILTVLTASGIDIFLCSLIFLVCIGKAPKGVLFVLNSPFWSILSALSLSAFLVHTEVIVLLTSQYDPPPNTTWATLLFLFCTTAMITYTLALGLYLTFEMPIGRLIDAVMRSYVLKWRPLKSQINQQNQEELEEEMSEERRSGRQS